MRLPRILAPLLLFQFAVALLRAFELFGRSHRLTTVSQQLREAAREYHGDQHECDDELAHRLSLMNLSMMRASVTMGTPPPVTTASLNLRKSNFFPNAFCAFVRSRLISLWPTL